MNRDQAVRATLRTAGAVTMATAIVSSAVSVDGQQTLSVVIFGAAAVVWALLVLAVVVAIATARNSLLEVGRKPIALTWVAATAVIGSRASIFGWERTAQALLVLSFATWLALLPSAAAEIRRNRSGASFLLAVSTESIAGLAARLAPALGLRWLAFAAIGWFALGVACYAYTLVHFNPRELLRGRGDQWIAGGAVAIASLTCARCTQAVDSIDHGIGHAVLHPLVLGLWACSAIWLVALICSELVARRSFFDSARWATVFPLGMYAACSFAAADIDKASVLRAFASVWTWVAFSAWAVVAVGSIHRPRATS